MDAQHRPKQLTVGPRRRQILTLPRPERSAGRPQTSNICLNLMKCKYTQEKKSFVVARVSHIFFPSFGARVKMIIICYTRERTRLGSSRSSFPFSLEINTKYVNLCTIMRCAAMIYAALCISRRESAENAVKCDKKRTNEAVKASEKLAKVEKMQGRWLIWFKAK